MLASMSFTEYLAWLAQAIVVATVLIVAAAIVLVTVFPFLGKDWGLPNRRFGR